LADVLSENGEVALVLLRDDAVAAEEPSLWALDQLQAALVANGASIRRLSGVAQVRRNEFCIVAAWTHSPLAQVIQRKWSIVAPAEPESLCLAQGLFEGRAVLLAAGSDALGLVYALTELADRVRCHSKPVSRRATARSMSASASASSY
jgi:hypothetical protein